MENTIFAPQIDGCMRDGTRYTSIQLPTMATFNEHSFAQKWSTVDENPTKRAYITVTQYFSDRRNHEYRGVHQSTNGYTRARQFLFRSLYFFFFSHVNKCVSIL